MTTARPTLFSQALPASLAQVLRDGKLFALVDGALLRELPDRVRRAWPESKSISLLTGSVGLGAAAVGPLLFELSAADVDTGLPATLADERQGRCAGSFLGSVLDLVSLARGLSPLTEVCLNDDSTMVMRFFDPQVLPIWLDVLPLPYQQYLGTQLHTWLHCTLDWSLGERRFSSPASVTFPHFPWQASGQDEQALLDGCYPHTVTGQLRREMPDQVATVPVSERYAFFKRQIERAKKYGIGSSSDVQTYCALALDLGTDFDEDPVIAEALKAASSGKRLPEALAEISDEDWARLAART